MISQINICMQKNKKIILIGCGNMGLAHLKSIMTMKNKRILVIEKRLRRINFIKKNYKSKDLKISNMLPQNQIFDFGIIATHSKDRFNLINELLKKNSIKFLFIEKFIFLKKREYILAKNLFVKKSTKVFVNIWAKLFINICKLNGLKKIEYFKILIRRGRILTNLIHYLSIIENLINRDVDLSFENNKFKTTKFQKKNFTEYYGKIKIKFKSKIIGSIEDSRDKYDYFFLKGKNYEKTIQIKEKKIVYKENIYNKKIFNFPLSSNFTKKILFNISSSHKKIVPNFNEASLTSQKILKKIRFKNLKIR